MRVAGHNVACTFLGLVAQHGDQLFDLALDVLAGLPQIQADVQRYLVVAAAAGVQPLASIAHAGGEGLLHKGVDILGVGVDLQRTGVQIV